MENLHTNDHLEQTLHRFINHIGERTTLEPERAEALTRFVLSQIVQRLPYQGAAHLIAQLPKLLQEDLLDLPAGPDRSITAETFLDGLATRFDFDQAASRDVLKAFWQALIDFLKNNEPHKVLLQLPEDIRSLFEEQVRDLPAAHPE